MADLDLRPLSLGEVLDRTFSLYRGHFSLFVGITAIPQLLILAYNLIVGTFPGVRTPTTTGQPRIAPGVVSPATLIGAFVALLFFWWFISWRKVERFTPFPNSIWDA